MPFEPFLAFSTGLAMVHPVAHEVSRAQPRVQYSAVTSTETRLPEGIRPASLLANRTGSLLVGDLISAYRSEAERTTEGSLKYIQQVAAALPLDEDDERVVDALVAKRTASLRTRRTRSCVRGRVSAVGRIGRGSQRGSTTPERGEQAGNESPPA
jgi:hypothetical protein